ncbi:MULTISPECIES: VOC family protein [Leptolyngbya]|uniref:VOC family protein n=1 Tax=Leptolyngbya TaxID=47251 RepID=UPI0016876C8E|nr:VOC family protein [Leptolyngbya sp. FACHB-1624]MBD1856771.1 VOC family protein [Leptolyngbya sp. FACHB-1624]
MNSVLFHLAFPVRDIPTTKAYYVDGLGCGLGRENDQAAILNLYDHQLVAHVTQDEITPQKGIYPRHFGLIFTNKSDWQALLDRAQQKQLSFYQQPKHRFVGMPLEHSTFFLIDPFGNLMEYKHYTDSTAIFGGDLNQIGDR